VGEIKEIAGSKLYDDTAPAERRQYVLGNFAAIEDWLERARRNPDSVLGVVFAAVSTDLNQRMVIFGADVVIDGLLVKLMLGLQEATKKDLP